MSITKQIEILLCKARHPSCTPLRRLELRAEVQRLQNAREETYKAQQSPGE